MWASALGQAFARALGDMRGIQRYGSFHLPMDEALILCAVDLSGRCTLNWDIHCTTEKVGDFDVECAKEFWLGFARSVPATVHFVQFAGENTHHILEACFKGAGHALSAAVKIDEATRTRSPPRKDCWYDRDHGLRRGQPVQPEIQPCTAGAGHGGHRRPRYHPQSDRLILPGVGAFGDAMDKLVATALCRSSGPKRKKSRCWASAWACSCCLKKAMSTANTRAWDLSKARCAAGADLTDKSLKVPQIGWNALHIVKDDPLFQYIREGEYVYYVHSYYGKNCTESTLATSEYSIPVTGAVRAGKVYGTQFHPEKSGDTGLRILKAFAEL